MANFCESLRTVCEKISCQNRSTARVEPAALTETALVNGTDIPSKAVRADVAFVVLGKEKVVVPVEKVVMAKPGSCCSASDASGPLQAMAGPKETILYVLCLQPPELEHSKAGYIATVDADPSSSRYGEVL